jgi:hypothetical protein
MTQDKAGRSFNKFSFSLIKAMVGKRLTDIALGDATLNQL